MENPDIPRRNGTVHFGGSFPEKKVIAKLYARASSALGRSPIAKEMW